MPQAFCFFLCLLLSAHVAKAALAANVLHDTVGGEVFLGGNYIELGIRTNGSFGTASSKPAGFTGTGARLNIGMCTDLDGFNNGVTQSFDYFLPGTPYVGWGAGYTLNGTKVSGVNQNGDVITDIVMSSLTDTTSAPDNATAVAVGTLNSNLKITQAYSLGLNSTYYRIRVSLENVGSNTLQKVRYQWGVDPDITKDISGSYNSVNTILNTVAADGKAVVECDSTGSATSARMYLYCTNPGAKGTLGQNFGINVYGTSYWDTAPAKGATETADNAVAMTVEVGTLMPGSVAQFDLFISLSNDGIAAFEASLPMTITSSSVKTAQYQSAFSYFITATHNPTGYDLTGSLPPGVNFNAATGEISGTPTLAGTYNVVIKATNATEEATSALAINVTQIPLTVTGLTASNKEYDRTVTAAITGTPVYSGILPADVASVTISGTPVGAFDTANVGTNKSVTVSGITLSGSEGGNYSVPLTLTADITAKPVTITGVQVANKVYNGTTAGTITNYGTVSGVISPDVVTVASGSAVATFQGAAVGSNKTVYLTGFALGGAAAGNYSLPDQPTATASITKAPQTLTIDAPNKMLVGEHQSVSARSSSGLPVTVTLVSGPAELTGNDLLVKGRGDIVIQATQAGDTTYEAITAQHTITVKIAQSISFGTFHDLVASTLSLTLSASASSELPVSFKVVSGPASLSGNVLTLTGTAGTVTIAASQAGNSDFQPADTIYRSFNVLAQSTRVFFGTLGSDTIAGALSKDGTSGFFIGYLTGSTQGFLVPFTQQPDGTYKGTATLYAGKQAGSLVGNSTTPIPVVAPAPASTLTFHGWLSNGAMAGIIDELGLNFSTAEEPASGPTLKTAGYYHALSSQTVNNQVYMVVGTGGSAYVLAITGGTVSTQTVSIGTDGSFALSLPDGTTGNGNANALDSTVSLTIKSSGAAPITLIGTKLDATRTDRLINLSARVKVDDSIQGNGTLVAGFSITGSQPKTVLLRGVGPSLSTFGISKVMADPRIRLYDSQANLLASNDDWAGNPEIASIGRQVGAFELPADSRDAAMVMTLAPGSYTMHVTDSGGSGVALAEVYDTETSTKTPYERLINISARGFVNAGDGVLIGGFIVTGNTAKRVLIRGVGPGLAPYGVSPLLKNPVLRLYDSAGALLLENDNWGSPAADQASAADIAAAGTGVGAFALAAGSQDAALLVTLPPNAYTATVSSADGSTGVALIEVYEIP